MKVAKVVSFLIASMASTQTLADNTARSDVDRALVQWVGEKVPPREAPTLYRYASVDLNGDSIPEAVLLITDLRYCGTGGCTLVVMIREAGHLKVISWSTISREPFCVAAERSNGWRSLIVRVAGGGFAAFDAILRFDGARYPLNPSMQPHASTSDLQSCLVLDMTEMQD
jgi:putative lipoprotein